MELEGVMPDTTAPMLRRLFSDKEMLDDVGMIDFGARWYDPAIGRFPSTDRYAEDFSFQTPYAYALDNPIIHIDINGDSPWVVNNNWTEEQISDYRSYAREKLDELVSNGKKFTCEDLALSIIIDYASDNNLPLEITNGTGTYSPSSDQFDNVEDFKNAVLNTTAASDLADHNNTIPILSPKSGDLLLFDLSESGRINHTQVVYTNNRYKIEIRQGNFREHGYRLTHSSNPKSWRYIGSKVQSGVHFKTSGKYSNRTTGSTTSNLYKTASIRQWNFLQWN